MPTPELWVKAYSLAVEAVANDQDAIRKLLDHPLQAPESFPHDLRSLWDELRAAHELIEPAKRGDAIEQAKQRLREKIAAVRTREVTREQEASTARTEVHPIERWTIPEHREGDFYDFKTKTLHPNPIDMTRREGGLPWTTDQSRTGWIAAHQYSTPNVFFWNAFTGERTQTAQSINTQSKKFVRRVTPSFERVSLSADGARAVVTAQEKIDTWLVKGRIASRVSVYDPSTGKLLRTWKHPIQEKILCESISADGKEVWLASEKSLFAWNLTTNQTRRFPRDSSRATSLRLEQSRPGLVLFFRNEGGKRFASVLDTNTGQELRQFDAKDKELSDDGRWFISVSPRRPGSNVPYRLHLLNYETGETMTVTESGGIEFGALLSPDESQLWVFFPGPKNSGRVVAYDLEKVRANDGRFTLPRDPH